MRTNTTEKELNLCKKLKVPPPTLSPAERLRKLMAYRNEWKLYKRKCDFAGKDIISAYHSDSPFLVYSNEVWWGDSWDALDYGRDFDFSRPFFDQFQDLQKEVPREGTSVFRSENCDYNGHIRESRNSYLNSLVYRCEDIYYSYWMANTKDSCDCYLALNSELCYWCIDVADCYNCVMLQEGTNCSDSHFSFQLRGCDHCLFCSNLNNKSYHLHNKPCSKEEFETAKAKVLDGSNKSLDQAFQNFNQLKQKTVHRYTHALNCENSTGDHIANLKNCQNCFESYQSEDCFNSISVDESRDVHSCYSAGWPGCDRIYNSVVTRGSTDIAYCVYTFFSGNLRYCDSSNDCHDCFGCIGLQHKRYCILNKQYFKEEYEQLLPRIIQHMEQTGEWGQFFPPHLTVFAYNETAAGDYLPLTKEQALGMGYTWREKDKKEYLPTTEDILACQDCGKNYKIAGPEHRFYKKFNLPAPFKCPECRHAIRFKMRNLMELFPRECDKCKAQIQSSYPGSKPETIFCGDCYNENLQ